MCRELIESVPAGPGDLLGGEVSGNDSSHSFIVPVTLDSVGGDKVRRIVLGLRCEIQQCNPLIHSTRRNMSAACEQRTSKS